MLAFGLAMAHFVYGDTKACILFVVQPGEKNVRNYTFNSFCVIEMVCFDILPVTIMGVQARLYRKVTVKRITYTGNLYLCCVVVKHQCYLFLNDFLFINTV